MKYFSKLFCFLFVCTTAYSQEVFFWSYPGYVGVGSALDKAQPDKKFQLNISGQNYHNDLVAPIWGASAWISPFPVSSPELSGWSLVTSVLHSHLVDRAQTIISPETWVYEIGIGRVMLFEKGSWGLQGDMGFRGHLEIVFRKLKYAQESKMLAESYSREPDKLSRSLFVKWGAGTFLWAEGLVDQKPGAIGFVIEGQLGMPLKNEHTVIFDISTQAYVRCGFRGAKCGVDFQAFRANSVKSDATLLEVQSFYKVGPFFEWQGQGNFSLKVALPWAFIRSAPLENISYNRSKKYPGLNVGISYGM